MNNIEDFIRQHKSEFDSDIPDNRVWGRIENRLESKDQSKVIIMWATKIAAAFIVVLVCGVLLGIMISRQTPNNIEYSASPELQKFKETESYYQQQVSLKLGQLQDSNTKSTVEEDLQNLDEIYQQLREEMIQSNYSNSDILINAMIKNHKTKVEILENILEKQNTQSNEIQKISI